jgi:nucleotide-sensitive chloride channel 1A
MALETINTSPAIADFTPLSEHQEATPVSFFGAKSVLHLHSAAAKLKISKDDIDSQPAIARLQDDAAVPDDDDQITVENVDIWVSSQHLTIFSQPKSMGVQIAYPTITVHAQEGATVFLGLNLSDSNTPDEDLVFIQLRIIPTIITDIERQDHEDGTSDQPNGHTPPVPAQALFKAISDCQELNPDPPEEGEEGGFDETAPGATGWITSENMQDFVGEDGEFRIPAGMTVMGAEDAEGALGEGAGRTRTADEVDGDGNGAEEETKWQRTG